MKIVSKLKEYRRVMGIARKPSKSEFISTAKICLVGCFAIGTIGFSIFFLFILVGLK